MGELSGDDRPRRRYDATGRQRQAAATRERIVDAGCELLRASSIRDWGELTIRAVAAQAGVNERTVYRHFGNERGLRDEVMARLERDAGIDLDGLRLEDVPAVAAAIFATVAAHPIEPRRPLDPTLRAAGERQRDALRRAVGERAAGWTEPDREVAAAMLDVLWSVAAYERLVTDWQLDHGEAMAAMTWVIELVETAVTDGRAPSAHRPAHRPAR